ncbi:unnamed protein product [Eruca vesicaria subsp. sativa]|uniref:DUF629 domain-containing protein n=1 Tax=Eruca vesicaria subsp. sativa TaxID=29727 RepID=A0ABC8KUB5_ERUVS|nr:unnamed protein product [Eruca vesicaria subsp. sativa]
MDTKEVLLLVKAKALQEKEDYRQALEIVHGVISLHSEEDKHNIVRLLLEEATIFSGLAMKKSETKDMEVTYFLGALGCSTQDDERTTMQSTCVLRLLGNSLGSVLYLKKCIRGGVKVLAASHSLEAKDKEKFERIIKEAEWRVKLSGSNQTIVNYYRPRPIESEEGQEPPRVEGRVGVLRSFWKGLDVNVKRGFMNVSIEKLRGFVKGVHKKERLDVFEDVLGIAREHKSWTVWVCRTKCDKVCFSVEDCKTHLEEKHDVDFKTSLDMVKRVGRNWVDKVQNGPWKPLDTVAAVEMIKTQLADVKAFTTRSRKKGWSDQWPLAEDEERSGLLKEIKLLLVLLCQHQILSFSIRDWVMSFPVKQLRELEVSEESIKECHLVETPQSICFLERDELSHIRDFLKKIKCERHDGTDHVCKAVDSLLERIGIKESLEFDEEFSLLLLDKRLLKRNNAPSDANAQAQGDGMISWLVDYSSADKSFPKPIREHNLDIWVAVLRALQYTCRALVTKYEKKKQVLDYEAALTDVETLCMHEDQRNSYESLLRKRSEERATESLVTSALFLCAVRDVLHEDGAAMHSTYDLPFLLVCMNLIRKPKSLSNDTVLKSIDVLKSMVTEKVLLIDAKILLIDNSRISLLNNLTRLSAFDNRSYMFHFLKPFLLVEAELLLKEGKKSLKGEKKSLAEKTQKEKSIKTTSKSMAKPVDKTAKQKTSVILEPQEGSKKTFYRAGRYISITKTGGRRFHGAKRYSRK